MIKMNKQEINNWIEKRIKESEEILKTNNTTYEAVLENQDTSEYTEISEINNFEAGVISALNQLKGILK